MNTWIKRSLATVAVAGGLVIGGAAAASADDASSTQQNDATSSFSSPIELGGISLGGTTESSSSSSVTETRTDDEGNRSSQTRTSQDASKNQFGIETGKITADPAGTVSSMTKSAQSSDDDTDRSASSSSQEGTVTGKAPISIGGLNVTGANERSSADSERTSTTDEDGETRTSERESAEQSATGGSFGVGELSLDPAGTLSGERSDSFTRDDEDVEGELSQAASGAFSSPFAFEGITGSFSDERASMDARRDTVTDEDGTRSEAVRNADASRTEAGFDTGAFAADPMGSFAAAREDVFSSEDEGDELFNRSESDSAFDLSAPFSYTGGEGDFSREDASATERETRVSDEDGTFTRVERTEDANAFGQVFGFDGGQGDLLGSFEGSNLFEQMFSDR